MSNYGSVAKEKVEHSMRLTVFDWKLQHVSKNLLTQNFQALERLWEEETACETEYYEMPLWTKFYLCIYV